MDRPVIVYSYINIDGCEVTLHFFENERGNIEIEPGSFRGLIRLATDEELFEVEE